jgi:hypothetical protein
VIDRCEDCAGLLAVSDRCTTADECCGQMICSGISDASDLRCCMRDTDPCEFNTDCCGAMQCVAGQCACQTVGQPCLTGRECCGAAFCDAGVCTT